MSIPTFPTITALAGAALALLQVALMLRVSSRRVATATGIGDGGDDALARRIRAHGNLTENSPLFLVLLLLAELSGRLPVLVGAVAAIFVLARICHAIGLDRSGGASALRTIGATGTALSIGLLAMVLLYLAVANSNLLR